MGALPASFSTTGHKLDLGVRKTTLPLGVGEGERPKERIGVIEPEKRRKDRTELLRLTLVPALDGDSGGDE